MINLIYLVIVIVCIEHCIIGFLICLSIVKFFHCIFSKKHILISIFIKKVSPYIEHFYKVSHWRWKDFNPQWNLWCFVFYLFIDQWLSWNWCIKCPLKLILKPSLALHSPSAYPEFYMEFLNFEDRLAQGGMSVMG